MNKFNEINNSAYKKYGVIIFDDIETLRNPDDETYPRKKIWAFLVVKTGSLRMNLNEKDTTITKNDLLFYSPYHYINNIETSDDFSAIVMVINSRLASELIHSNVDMMKNLFYVGENPTLHLTEKSVSQCLRYFELIRYKRKDNISDIEDEDYTTEIIQSIARAALYEWAASVKKHIPENYDNRTLKQGERLFKNFIYELTNDHVKSRSVTDYANRLCVTPKYLSAVCKQVSGNTASSFINFYMVKDIKQLLKYSDKSIKEIAQNLGFPNLSFFGKYVKAHLGISPSAYRKKRF